MIREKELKDSKNNIRWLLLILVLLIGGIVIFWLQRCQKEPDRDLNTNTAYLIKGIDLSHHNPFPNWRKLEEEGVHFVYLKATEGSTHEDKNYPCNYNEGRNSNIKIGAYHFYTFAESGLEQAKHFIRIANSQQGDLIPAIDVEHSPTNPHSYDEAYISKVVKELKVLEEELHKHYGIRPLIYTNNECYRLYIEKNFPDNLLWIVDLEREPSSQLKNWRIWQFSHIGRVAGLNAHTDLNYYRYTAKEFSELLLP